jgi:hypothetical protein
MKSSKSKAKSVSKQEAVPVSFRLQFAVVAAAFSAWAFQLTYALSAVSPRAGRLDNFGFVNLISVLFPLIVFGIVLLSSPRYRQPLSSLFVATLKTLLALFLFAVLVGLKNWILTVIYSPGAPVDASYRWIMSPGVDLGLMGITLFSLLYVLREQRLKKA